MRSVKTSTYSNTTQMAIQNYQLAFIDVAAPEGSGMTVCRREWSLQNVWSYPESRHPPARHELFGRNVAANLNFSLPESNMPKPQLLS